MVFRHEYLGLEDAQLLAFQVLLIKQMAIVFFLKCAVADNSKIELGFENQFDDFLRARLEVIEIDCRIVEVDMGKQVGVGFGQVACPRQSHLEPDRGRVLVEKHLQVIELSHHLAGLVEENPALECRLNPFRGPLEKLG